MVKSNDLATLAFSEMPGRTFTGLVDRTAGAIDPVSRTLLTEVLVSNRDGVLFPGAHTMVRLHVANAANPVIVPVNTLLFRNDQGVQAGVVDSNGIVRLADVTVGRDYGTTVEIVQGLSETDNVIINPSDSLEAGIKVRLAATGHGDSPTAHE
jgi:multidrug efflux pump subunit AcrA (membrane-fusion protein)